MQYVKVPTEIMRHTLRDAPNIRHLFVDLLLLADIRGVVRVDLECTQKIQKISGLGIDSVAIGMTTLRRLGLIKAHEEGLQIQDFEKYRGAMDAREIQTRASERAKRYMERLKKKAGVECGPVPKEAGGF